MSAAAIRDALETAVQAMSPSIVTIFENVAYTPVVGTPYQRINILFAQPDNTEISASYQERGILQFTLFYPSNAGNGDATARADLIRSTFYRGRSLAPVNGVTVTIDRTPEIAPAQNAEGWYVLPCRVRFWAPVTVTP